MKKGFMLFMVLIFCVAGVMPVWATDGSITGVWSMPVLKGKDKGKERLQVEIFEKDGAFYGKIVKLSSGMPPDAVCKACKNERKDKPLMGMLVLWEMKKESGRYVDGKVFDVDEGKDYKCSMALVTPEKLKVTACLLFLCDSHYWTKVK